MRGHTGTLVPYKIKLKYFFIKIRKIQFQAKQQKV